ncbi:MAG: NAD(+)/NADH kinase [Thermoplasmata archaeon]|nr:NAD(+)/NADH kinase [Thermoplasmata archaeon]
MRYGLLFNPQVKNALEYARQVYSLLEKEHIVVDSECAQLMGKVGVKLEEAGIDILLTIGGDGTILRALHRTNAKIFGINAGVLGFLTEIKASEIKEGIARLLDGKYLVERRMRIAGRIDEKKLPDALNEVVIHTSQVSKMRAFEIYVDNTLIQKVRADGIIVSTPTGSTSYAMSAGSPIVDPRVEAIVVVPLAPFKMSIRPYVVPATSNVEVKLPAAEKPCVVVVDGQEEVKMKPGAAVRIRRSENDAEFIRFETDFYKKLEEKLIATTIV